jgi:hypothetical protein
VSVELADTVPDDIQAEDIGFHPKYGAEYWDVDGNTIAFSRSFEPGEEFVTVFGLRGKDARGLDRFLTEPVLTAADPVKVATDDDVGDVNDGDAETGSENGDGPVDVSEPETGRDQRDCDVDLDLDLQEPGEEDDPPEDLGSVTADPPTDAAVGTDAASIEDAGETEGSLAAALAAEIRNGAVDEAALADLRDALGVAAAGTGARIDHLQSTVADLEAYIDAFEAFLDDEGDARTVLADVRADYETAIDRIEALESDIANLEAELSEVAEMRDRLATPLGGIDATGETDGATGEDSATGDDSDAADGPEVNLED